MTDTPGERLTEEPQSERGPVGSRDTGSDEPGGGPAGPRGNPRRVSKEARAAERALRRLGPR